MITSLIEDEMSEYENHIIKEKIDILEFWKQN